MRLPSFRIWWPSGSDANSITRRMVLCLSSRVRLIFCSFLLIFAVKKHNGAESVIQARDQRIVPRKLLPVRCEEPTIKLRSNSICLCAKYFEFKFCLKNLIRENTENYEILW
jgi:hypothetical protein